MTFSGLNRDLLVGNQKVTWKKLGVVAISPKAMQVLLLLLYDRQISTYLPVQINYQLVVEPTRLKQILLKLDNVPSPSPQKNEI